MTLHFIYLIDCYLESAILDSSASPKDNVLFLVKDFKCHASYNVIPKDTIDKVLSLPPKITYTRFYLGMSESHCKSRAGRVICGCGSQPGVLIERESLTDGGGRNIETDT